MYYRLSLRSQRCRPNKLDNPIFSYSLARLLLLLLLLLLLEEETVEE